MALIGSIRKNPIIVLLFIGGGILLFVIGEMTSGANGPIGPVERRMGSVGHREIDGNEFEQVVSGVFSGGDAYQNRDVLWNYYVTEAVIGEEAEEIGLAVSREELRDLEFGPQLSPVVQNNLRDPQTGQVNRELLTTVQGHIDDGTLDEAIRTGQLNSNFKTIWNYQRRQIITNRLQEKMGALVSKAFYAPSWQAQNFADDQIDNRRVAYVKVPYTELGADDEEVTDDAITAHIEENRSLFDNPQETRTLSYVTFEVSPTEEDLADLRTEMGKLATDWKAETSTEGDSLFAVSNNGSYTGNYDGADRLDVEASEALLNEVETGGVYGPYEQDGNLRLAKLIDRVTMPDSADTRHILISASTPEEFEAAGATVDSLMNVLESRRGRRKFGDLAAELSEDPGSKDEGGKYEAVVPGQFVRPFDEVLFRTGKVGELYKVRTSHGVHLVEILERSRSTSQRAKVAYVSEPIIPSTKTENATMDKAQDFLDGKKTVDDLREAGMEVTTTAPLAKSTYNIAELGSGQEVRNMMCFAFSADEGEVAPEVYRFTDEALFYDNKYIVAGVANVIPKGLAPVAAVRESVEPQVRNKVVGQRVKGELNGKSLDDVASQYGVSVDTVSSNPTLTSLPGIGSEPKVIAAAAVAPTGTSVVIAGNTGIYVIAAQQDAPAGTSGSLPGARSQLNGRVRGQASAGLLPALRASAEVEDERMDFDCSR